LKRKRIFIGVLILINIIISSILYFWILPLNYEKECKNRVYYELQEELLKANIEYISDMDDIAI